MPEFDIHAAFMGGGLAAVDPQSAHSALADAALHLSAQGDDQMARADAPRYAVVGGVAHLSIAGLLTPNSAFARWLGWTTYHGLESDCAAVMADQSIRAAVIWVDSPGGMVLGVEGAAAAVARLAAPKPVHALIKPLAASAAYWIASQATEIVMAEGAEVGSIGVMTATRDQVSVGSDGFQQTIFSSAHAGAKAPRGVDEAGAALITERINATESRFHAAVEAGRGLDAGELVQRMAIGGDPANGGAMFTPERAVEVGLADAAVQADRWLAQIAETYAPQAAISKPSRGAGSAMARARAAIALSR